jgi:FkbM family methyltransferase
VARKLKGVRDRVRGSVLRLLYTPRLRPAAHGHKLSRLGSPYGAWTFIDTPALRGARVVSCGLGEDASFDVEFAAAYGAQVLLVDPTPKALRHYEAIRQALGKPRTLPYSTSGRQPVASYELAALADDSLRIVPKALWNQQTRLKFYAPPDPDHVSHSILNIQGGYREDGAFIEVEATTVDRLVQEYGLDEIRLMKVDIEGAEIEVIHDMLRRGIRPQQLLVEYDELNFPSRRSRRRVRECHRALLASGYKLVHVDAPSNFLYTTL